MGDLIARISRWVVSLFLAPRGRHRAQAVTQRTHQAPHQPRTGEFDELAALTRCYLAMREER